MVFTEEYWPNKTWNYEHSEDSFCVCFPCDGVSMVATACRLDFGSAAVTEIRSSRVQYLRSGRLEATKSACNLLTRDTEQQLSNSKGRRNGGPQNIEVL